MRTGISVAGALLFAGVILIVVGALAQPRRSASATTTIRLYIPPRPGETKMAPSLVSPQQQGAQGDFGVFADEGDFVLMGADMRLRVPAGIFSNRDVRLEGMDNVIDGPVQARRYVRVNGFANRVRGECRYGEGASVANGYGPRANEVLLHKGTAELQPNPALLSPALFHIDYYYEGPLSFAPGQPPLRPGTYYVQGNLHIYAENQAIGPVTFLVTDAIHVSATEAQFIAHQHGVVFYSLRAGIHLTGTNLRWQGDVLAPSGLIVLFGRDNRVRGRLAGWGVRLLGQEWRLE